MGYRMNAPTPDVRSSLSGLTTTGRDGGGVASGRLGSAADSLSRFPPRVNLSRLTEAPLTSLPLWSSGDDTFAS
jgi:hypothetical protein